MKKLNLLASICLLSLLYSSTPVKAGQSAAQIDERANSFVKKMTLEEKVDYIGGSDGFYVRAIPRLKLPAFKMSDGPIGVRNYGPSTTYAAGIGLAATWDTDLAGQVGTMIGKDARARGVHFMLGPGVNIYRAPMNGRNFEYFGEDPFLASRVTVAYIKGVQEQGVSSTVKHYMGNNTEEDRHNTSSDMDERTMREIYLPAFEAAVKEAHVGAIMNSYNFVNGVHATQNDFLNNKVAKKEWGFDGIMMSDWDATYDGVAAANAGLDLEMPDAKFMNRAALLPAIKDGKVSMATLDDKVRRILRTAIRLGWLDRDQTDHSWPLDSPEARKVALQTAQGSIVLLKNKDGLLPLNKSKIHSIAVLGPDADPAVPDGGGSAQVKPFYAISYLKGLKDLVGGSVKVQYSRGLTSISDIYNSTQFTTEANGGKPGLTGEYFNTPDLKGKPTKKQVDAHVNFTWYWDNNWPGGAFQDYSGRWTGYFTPKTTGEYQILSDAFGEDGTKLYLNGKLLVNRKGKNAPMIVKKVALKAGTSYSVRLEFTHCVDFSRMTLGIQRVDQIIDPAAEQMAKSADAVVVCVGFDSSNESEGYNRTFQLPLDQDELIKMALAANKNVIVVITAGGATDMTRWVNKVPAVLQAWYPGQEGGTALAQILLGDISPSGKLPASFEKRWEDSAAYANYKPDAKNHIAYKEGVFLGYRHFDKSKVKPLFPFGFGLSYTTFKYDNLAITPVNSDGNGPITVSFDLTNTGDRAGAEVAEVYVGDSHSAVPRPVKELKGFAKVNLKPGETKKVSVTLDKRALSYFDVASKDWKAEPGQFNISVGSSSDNIELKGQLTLK